MLLFDAPLTFREFMTDEKLPLATIFREVLGALRGRRDVVLFGAQAVKLQRCRRFGSSAACRSLHQRSFSRSR